MADSGFSGDWTDRQKSPEIGHAPGTGIHGAFKDRTYSCSLALSSCQHGGARNRADRESEKLSGAQVDRLIAAADFALATGRTFQRHWIIHYGKAGIGADDGARFVGKLLDLVGKHARRAGGELTALWVREQASDYGEHVHILMHLPTGLHLRNRTRRWIVAAGGTYRQGVSAVRIVGGKLTKAGPADLHGEAHYRANARNVVGYLLKSSELEKGQRLGLKYSGRGGSIIGKRCGWTQNIGLSRRASLK